MRPAHGALALACVLALAAPALAQDHARMPPAQVRLAPAAQSGAQSGATSGATPAGWPSPVSDNALYGFTLIDLLEFQRAPNTEAARWDIYGWYGTDTDRLWYKTSGRSNGRTRRGDGELQLLYGRLVSPFFDLQAGLRHERFWGPGSSRGRTSAVLGVQGVAPYGAETELALFVSQDGDVSARATFAQNFLLTQRLILLPRIEVNAAVQRAARYGIGAGLNDIELGVRLRYEIRREFAPYVGVSWLRSFGETAGLREREGQNRSLLQFVAGVRMWF